LDWKKESEMFNQMADYYDKYRPSYPNEIINILIEKTKLTNGSKLLEIGAGSGKATELFTSKGFEILCIEPGSDLVKRGNERFEDENFKFVEARFEDYPITLNHFDVVFSAQAFHWVPQPIGYEKCSATLKDSGYLAIIYNMYIAYDNDFDNELLTISNKYSMGLSSAEDCEKRADSIVSGIIESGLFSKPEVIRSSFEQTYTPDEYFGFVLTGNSFIQKTEEEKQAAHKELEQLANKHNGIIKRPYICALYLTQKL